MSRLDLHALQPGHCGWCQVDVPLGSAANIEVDVFVCAGHAPGPSALVTAGVHGDEYEGPLAIGQVADTLAPENVRGVVYLVPVANPLAFAAGTRLSPADGLNLARVFPGKEDGTPTERLAYFLFHQFGNKADYLIDLHSGGVEYEFLPVAGFYGEPGLGNSSFQTARTMGLPALWQLPETSGVLSYEATRIGKVAVGAEYLGGGRVSEEGVQAYARSIERCLQFWRIIDLPASPDLPEPRVFCDDWLVAEAAGIFRTDRKLGDHVVAGSELATIVSPRGEILSQLVAPYEGIVLGLRSRASIRTGNWALLLARQLI